MAVVTITTDAGNLAGYLSEPGGAFAVPGVVVLHEALGLNDDSLCAFDGAEWLV